MADTYKILGQGLAGAVKPLGSSFVTEEALIYEVPENKKAAVSSIHIVNSSSANQNYRLSFVPKDDVPSTIQDTTYQDQIDVVKIIQSNTYNSTISYTSDGISWNFTNHGFYNGPISENDPIFLNGVWYASYSPNYYSYRYFKSTNGVDWTEFFISPAIPTGEIRKAKDKLFVFQSDPHHTFPGVTAYYSEDGTVWSSFNLPPSSGEYVRYSRVEYVENNSQTTYIIFFDNRQSYAVYSTNLSSWSTTNLPYNLYWSSGSNQNINGRLVMLRLNDAVTPGSVIVVTTTDAISWGVSLQKYDQNVGANLLRTMVKLNNKLYAITANYNNSYVHESSDGLSWTTYNFNQVSIHTILEANQKLFFYGYDYGVSEQVLYYADPLTISSVGFTRIYFNVSNSGFGIGDNIFYLNGRYILPVPSSSFAANSMHSQDLVTWTLATMPNSGLKRRSFSGTFSDTVDLPVQLNLSYNKHYAIYDKTILPGNTHEIKGGITLSSGDQIRVYSDSDEIIVNVYGVEIS